jgi:protein involved in polysaccharide export with SLBB domain
MAMMLMGVLGAGGCRHGATLPPAPPPPVTTEFVLHPGDQVDVRFYKTPELNLERIPVRPDGRISCYLIGDVQAAGRTPAELAAALRSAYQRELDQPKVEVIVRSVTTTVYVQGEVGGGAAASPGGIQYVDGMTALQAISQAGGFRDSAARDSVILIRREGDEYRGYRLDLEKATDGKDFSDDVRLAPRDIVVIPRSGIAQVNLFVQQYIRNNLPIDPSIAALAF